VSRPSEDPTYDAPVTATAGETLVWLLAAPDTPANDGWACAVSLTPAIGSVQTVAAAPEGTGPDFRVTVTAAATTSLGAGNMGWSALATKAGEGVLVGRGRVLLVAPSGRTPDETYLADLKAAIQQRALGGIAAYAIAGRTFTHLSLAELQAEYNRVASRVRTARTGSMTVTHLVTF
jgi:hypothetical protein